MTADQDSLLAGVKPVKWWVYRQFQIAGEVLDAPVSGHRFELAAELHARWLSRRHTHETGGHYTARRAERATESDLRHRRSGVYFCATCAVDEGEEHLDWCHRDGVMRRASA